MKSCSIFTAAALAVFGFCSSAAQAAVVTATAADNATMQPAGPRTGANGKAFLNIEGDSYNTFASYGVVDFSGAAFSAASVASVSGLTFTLTESNAAFSVAGNISVYLASDPSATIAPGAGNFTAPVYTNGLTPAGIGATAAFGTLTLLGTVIYENSANGDTDALTLSSLPSAVDTYLTAALNGGTTIRLVITPDSATTAATFAGATNNNLITRPTLALTTVVPEPAAMSLLALPAAALLRRRK